MGVARLLAKSWIVLCLFAGGHAIAHDLAAGSALLGTLIRLVPPVILFGAMGMLFIAGYGISAHGFFTHVRREHLMPQYVDFVFLLFAIVSFANQVLFAPLNATGTVSDWIEGALAFAVPGQRALATALVPCTLDGGRVFASAIAWVMTFVLFGSSLSRIRLAASLLKVEHNRRPYALNLGVAALLLGVAAIVGIQLLLVGTVYHFLPCDFFETLPGQVLIGLGPLMLAYVTTAALTALMATGEE